MGRGVYEKRERDDGIIGEDGGLGFLYLCYPPHNEYSSQNLYSLAVCSIWREGRGPLINKVDTLQLKPTSAISQGRYGPVVNEMVGTELSYESTVRPVTAMDHKAWIYVMSIIINNVEEPQKNKKRAKHRSCQQRENMRARELSSTAV